MKSAPFFINDQEIMKSAQVFNLENFKNST